MMEAGSALAPSVQAGRRNGRGQTPLEREVSGDLEMLEARHLKQFSSRGVDDLDCFCQLRFEIVEGDAGLVEVADEVVLDGDGMTSVIPQEERSFDVRELQSANSTPQLVDAGGRPHQAEAVGRIRLIDEVAPGRLLDDMKMGIGSPGPGLELRQLVLRKRNNGNLLHLPLPEFPFGHIGRRGQCGPERLVMVVPLEKCVNPAPLCQ